MPDRTHIVAERRIAKDILTAFGLGDAPYAIIKTGTTTTFQVRPRDQAPLVLRLQPLSRMPLPAVQGELAWLSAIRTHTSLLVPEPIAGPTGEFTAIIPQETAETSRVGTLFTWLPGHHKRRISPHDATMIGESLGTLHQFASSYEAVQPPTRWDFDADDFANTAESLEELDTAVLTLEDVKLLRDALTFVLDTLQALETQADMYGLIHGDPNLTNWLFQADRVALLDFEVCCYGYYLFDIGRVLHELERDTTRAAMLVAAFHHGYQRVRAVPPVDDDRIQAGKLMSLLDIVFWVCTLEPWIQREWGFTLLHQTVQQVQQSWRRIGR